MFWKTDFGKLLVILLIAFVIVLPFSVYLIILNSQPVQTAHVEVVSKRLIKGSGAPALGNNNSRFVTFSFPDGSRIEFNVRYTSLDEFQGGDTGVISYKQRKGSTKLSDLRFVSFEKDS